MKEPIISVCRQSKKIAVFDGFDIQGDFTPFEDEETAINLSKLWIKVRTDKEPKIVYPVVKSMKMTYGRRKK